jgi:NACalpha-BTF3-like transcription factor
MRRWLIVLVLAFGWLFSTPANADVRQDGDTFQFSYTWGSVTRTFTDSVVTITVVNDITNKIGGNGEIIDTYRITLGDQVIEVTEKHGARDYTYTITESQTLTLEGIDRGFWAGFYGPVMTIAVTPIVQPEEPVTQSPETQSQTTSEATTSPTQSESASPEPTTEPQPTPTPSPEPSPSPEPIQPPPPPEPTPLETPTASFPTQSPEPEPTQSPTSSSEPVSQSPQVTEPTPQASRTPEAQTPQVIEPSPLQSSEGVNEEPPTTAPQVTQIPEETISDTVSSSIQASVTQAIGAVTEAVGELVEAFATAGLDMTPEQREEAQDVVVSTVMASQVAAGIRKIK